jgi:hypothetical protein
MMEILNVLKVIAYVVWSLVGLTTIGATIWSLNYQKKSFNYWFKDEMKEEKEVELKVVK